MSDDKENGSQPTKKDDEELPETPFSDDRNLTKLTIKFKIANVEKGVEEDRIRPQGSQCKVCPVCNKEFSSGKALGGHIKVHFQVHNKPQSLKQLKTHHQQPIKFKKQNLQWVIDSSENRDSNEATNESRQTVCLLCKKNFSSMKALFGHMRCHSERERKGIEPPMAAKNSPSSSVSEFVPGKIDDHIDSNAATVDNPVIDLMKSLPRWPVTARRNTRVVVATLEYSSSGEEVEKKIFNGAAEELLRLAQGSSFNSGLIQNDRIDEYEAINGNAMTNEAEIENRHRVSESNNRRIEESLVGYGEDYPVKKLRIEENTSMDKGKGKAVLETENCEDYMNCTDDESDVKDTEDLYRGQLMNYKCESTSPRSVMSSRKNIKRNKQIVIRGSPNKYQCSTCDRCYSTKQALSGHMSYHKRDKNSHNTIDDSSFAAAEDKHHPNPISGVDDGKLVESTHQCEICNTTFLTVEALGGHKRYCHLSSPVEAPPVHKILGFDLNEAPPMEEDEECR